MAICCVSFILRRCGVPPSTPHFSGLPALPAGERLAGAPVNGISQTQLASACLREAASAKAGPSLSNLEKMTFSALLG
jgi:hypothetical protein